MPARPPRTGRFDLFEHTVTGMTSRVQGIDSPERLMTALRWGLAELDRAYDDAPARVRASVACRSGCDACCRVPVDVQAHEVLYAADHILLHFAPDALEKIVSDLAAHRARVAAFAPGQRDTSRQACPLLRDGACSIYAGRPQPCRAHHTRDADVCAAYMTDPTVDIEAVYIPALRGRMFAVMLGVDAALEAAGYDERSYDFGSALHEALTNSRCLPAWLRREPTFPDDCLSEPPQLK